MTLQDRIALRTAVHLLESYVIEDGNPQRSELCEQSIKIMQKVLDRDRRAKNAET